MNRRATAKFWKRYHALPNNIQELANKNFELLKSNPLHPSLHFKEISGQDDLWAARVGDHFRALALREESELYLVLDSSHAEYNRIISQ